MSQTNSSKPTNFLTFDIEEWYHANYQGLDTTQFKDRPIEFRRLMGNLLDLCAFAELKSTFFVLGSIAEKYPDVVRSIQSAGHEVASHGYGHELVYTMSPRQFRQDLEKSSAILEGITGEKIRGFRAPSFSVTEGSLHWYYQTLEECGFSFSSSVFAGKTFLYGIPGFPDQIHQPALPGGLRTTIWEFPVPAMQVFGQSVGIYVRLFPAWLIRRLIRERNDKGKSQMLYVHPREIDPGQPRLPLPPVTSFIHYFGVNDCEKKLKAVFRGNKANFGTLGSYLEQLGNPA